MGFGRSIQEQTLTTNFNLSCYSFFEELEICEAQNKISQEKTFQSNLQTDKHKKKKGNHRRHDRGTTRAAK
jgi:hypothetical protein